MSQTVFILGAGASKESGAPLMAEFIDVAERVWREIRGADPRSRHFETFFRAIGELQAVHSKAILDIKNIESVFAAFEMAQTLGRFGDYTQEQLDELLESTKQVIAATLDWTTRFDLHSTNPSVLTANESYGSLRSAVDYLDGTHPCADHCRRSEDVTIITLNYDLAVDFALEFEAGIDYSLPAQGHFDQAGHVRWTPSGHGTPVLKLHGSLNWGRCPKCGALVAVEVDPFLFDRYSDASSWHDHHFVSAKLMALCEHCPGASLEYPVLIPPTWNKAQHRREFAAIWRRAARALSEAQRIVVAGYSLPPSDVFMQYLYVVGAVGKTHLRRFIVIDPDDTKTVENRFRNLLGPSAQQRFEYRQQTFQKGLDDLVDEIYNGTF